MNLLKSKTILIVEDDPGSLFVLSELIKDEGYLVQAAENGIVALEIIEKFGIPDLILLDMIMPKMNGWDFAREFHRKYENQCPILVMTAAADAEQRATDVKAIGLIEKPFDFEKLLIKINKYTI